MAKRILIIEDEQFVRELYQELLRGKGYQVEAAADGEIGYEKISQGGYDLVLLDLILPKLDGIGILEKLKKLPAKKPNKKIVMMTNLSQDEVIKKGKTLGAVGVLVKSDLTPDEFVNEVGTYLK